MANKVDAMIVGAPKSGTTSLLSYLKAHPMVRAPLDVEFTGFDPRNSSDQRAGELADFLERSPRQLTLAKHADAYHRPAEIELILQHNPACRLILILRDPVHRAYSAFRMAPLRGEPQSKFSNVIDQALTLEAEGHTEDYRVRRYLRAGRYVDWCSDLLARCDRDQVTVLLLETFQRDPARHYRGLCEWLGVDPGFLPDFSARENVGGDVRSELLALGIRRLRSEENPVKQVAKRMLPNGLYRRLSVLLQNANKRSSDAEPIDSTTESRLREYFAEPNSSLAQLLGKDLDWMSANHSSS
jgi:Sulfotransferase domain